MVAGAGDCGKGEETCSLVASGKKKPCVDAGPGITDQTRNLLRIGGLLFLFDIGVLPFGDGS